jgi:hypothetical protein
MEFSGLGVFDEDGTQRSQIGGSVGFLLYDTNGTLRFSADTVDENNTALSLLDVNGKERSRLSAKGEARTFDKDGYDRFILDEEGALRILDGDIEAFTVDKYGIVGADQDGNVTLAFDRLQGRLSTSGDLIEKAPATDLDPEEMKKE